MPASDAPDFAQPLLDVARQQPVNVSNTVTASVPARGVATVTWPGGAPTSTTLVVSHGMSGVPVVVVAQGAGTSGLSGNVPAMQTFTYTATQFSIQAQTTDGTSPVAGSTVTVAWIASQ